jgi:pimeloyl-ACP methyl ester carboxylesterase
LIIPGIPVWFETTGPPADPSRETFLLLHGFGGSSFSWREWAPALAARGHVVVVDLKGFGRAPKPADGAYAPRDHASALMRLIEELDLRRITLVGHSMGGGIALQVALGLRDAGEAARLHRLVLVAGAAYRQRLPPFVALARHPRATRVLMRLLGPDLVISQALRSMVFEWGSITGDQIRGYAEPMGSRESVDAILCTGRQIVPDDLDDVAARYGEIVAPTLLLWGRQDRVVPPWVGERLSRTIRGSTLRILERCGHLPQEEAPRQSLSILERFLEGSS